ncbi:MAG TPA: hypothetical protein PL161_12715, partial [Spirochaetota bacterium]|nr:hypothetical protein [Spirochaetota bacterium]
AGESILGTAVEGQNYIKLVPTSDDNIAAYYTQSAPTWNAELGGWYGVGDSANHRYIAGFTFNLSSYTEKFFLYDVESLTNRRYGSGELNQTLKILTPEAIIDKASISNVISYKPTGYYLVTVQGLNSFTIKKPVTIVLPIYSTEGPYPIYYTATLEICEGTLWHQCNDPSSPARAIAVNPGTYRIKETGSHELKLCGGFGFVQGTPLEEIFTA